MSRTPRRASGTTLRPILVAGGLGAAAAALPACEQRDGPELARVAAPPPAAMSEKTDGAARWPFWPTQMRYHPLTRVTRDDATGQLIIEARIEMFDRERHTSKALGQLRVDLHDASDEGPAGSISHWNLDLRDLAFNRERFDEVTSTYLFRLDTDPAELPAQPVLHAYFVSENGAMLSARIELRT